MENKSVDYDNYKVGLVARFFGGILIYAGNVVYGNAPSYKKFRAIEVIARVPYQSWASAMYTLLTMFYSDEKLAIQLSNTKKFAREANDNETMHVVVISHIVTVEHKKVGIIRHTFIPMIFAFFYFWISYVLFMIHKKWSYEINYIFESHANEQYSIFVNRYEEALKGKELHSEFLDWYGRHPKNQYEFFVGVRDDEIAHRNRSVDMIHTIGKSI
jgi:hypothetical protein